MFFSTNGVAFPERIINLIKMLENTVNNNFVLEIQFSYDGYKPTRESRGIDPNIIINNLKTIITTLNQMTLNKVRILISCHNVVNEKIFNKFGSNNDDNDKEFLEYLKELNDLPYSLINLNKNQSLEIVDHFSPGIVTPYNATKEEGKNLTNFILKADKIGTELESQWWRGLMYQFDESLRHNHCFTLDIIPELMNGNQDLAKYLSNFCGCGYGGYDFKLRYDGTAVHCQNSVGMLKNSSLANRNDLSAQLHLNLIKKNYFPNFLTDSEKDIKKFLLRSKIAKNSSYPCFFSEVLNLMIMLLNSQQIDESYNDYEKLFRHGMIISQNFICWDNCLTSTGSGFGKYAGEIRLYCNGFLDLVEDSQEEFKEKFCKGVNNEN